MAWSGRQRLLLSGADLAFALPTVLTNSQFEFGASAALNVVKFDQDIRETIIVPQVVKRIWPNATV
jgi:hypothetical protein